MKIFLGIGVSIDALAPEGEMKDERNDMRVMLIAESHRGDTEEALS